MSTLPAIAMPYFTYVLLSTTRIQFYVGHTGDMNERIFEHNNNRSPWVLYYSEEFSTKAEAARRERAINKDEMTGAMQRFALLLLEVIAELSYGHEARMRWPSTTVQLQVSPAIATRAALSSLYCSTVAIN